jgi:hypothetical protein
LDISGSSSSLLKRKAFAGMLSEALCSRAKRVSETRAVPVSNSPPRKPVAQKPRFSIIPEEAEPAREGISLVTSSSSSSTFASKGAPEHEEYPNTDTDSVDAGEIPFARRAKLNGKRFRGGKVDGRSCFYLSNEKNVNGIHRYLRNRSYHLAMSSACSYPGSGFFQSHTINRGEDIDFYRAIDDNEVDAAGCASVTLSSDPCFRLLDVRRRRKLTPERRRKS